VGPDDKTPTEPGIRRAVERAASSSELNSPPTPLIPATHARPVPEVLREAKHIPETFELKNPKMVQLSKRAEEANPPFAPEEANTGDTLTALERPTWARREQHDSVPPGNKEQQSLEYMRAMWDVLDRFRNSYQKDRKQNAAEHMTFREKLTWIVVLGIIGPAFVAGFVTIAVAAINVWSQRHPVQIQYVPPTAHS
jgi:hypothetical protein